MLPKLYRIHLASAARTAAFQPEVASGWVGGQISQAQLLTLEILVWLLQVHKQVKIERLAAHFPLPIKYESRRRHIQRLLISSAMERDFNLVTLD